MKIRTLYICETCNTEFEYKESALICEEYKLPPRPKELQVGTKVYCYQRYDDPDLDVIVRFEIRPYINSYLDNWQGYREEMKERIVNVPTHQWVAITKNSRYLGKDEDSYTNEMSFDLIWLPGGEKGMFSPKGE